MPRTALARWRLQHHLLTARTGGQLGKSGKLGGLPITPYFSEPQFPRRLLHLDSCRALVLRLLPLIVVPSIADRSEQQMHDEVVVHATPCRFPKEAR